MVREFFAGTSTQPTWFSQPSGTQREPAVSARQPEVVEPTGLAEWLNSPEAKKFEGRWVLLTDDFTVKDSAPTPSEILDNHPEDRSPFIVFVRSSNTTYVV